MEESKGMCDGMDGDGRGDVIEKELGKLVLPVWKQGGLFLANNS